MPTLIRQDDTMVAVETASAIVDYTDILDATEVVYDEWNSDAPWEMCSGFDHNIETVYSCDMQGYCYSEGNREFIVIVLPDGDNGLYQWHREQGATKQVAREAVAAARRRTLAQLVDWYSNGWQWYGVKCNFEILGKEFCDSVWGIDDSDCAESDIVPEVADNVADQLEKAGFTVTGRPADWSSFWSREQKQEHIRYNLNNQNWRD